MPDKSHGMSRTPIYNIWKLMHKRCIDVDCRAYKNYGGRGISVCKRWASFESFYADMGDRPKGKTLDRYPDNDGDYKPSNCRWATPMEQSANSRRRRLVEFKGKEYHISGFCREFGISYDTIRARLQRGWSVRRAINQPIGKYGRNHT